jgi:cytochrome P450
MAADQVPVMPFERADVVDLAPAYRALQADRPVARVITPAGDPAWLVTGYEQVRVLFPDERLRRAHPDPDRAPRFTESALALGGPIGNYETEKADNARMRRLLTRNFMTRRMNALRPHVQELVDGLLTEMAAEALPVDLHETVSFPLPVLVICELLGVPAGDRGQFRVWTDQMSHLSDGEVALAGFLALRRYMGDLIDGKREQPEEDVISDLIAAQSEEDGFTDNSLVDLCVGILFAGHETTMARVDLGTVLLLTHPDQRDELVAHPELVHGAVEEILRFTSPTLGVILRYADADLEVEGVRIQAGDLVLLSQDAANRDERVFADPDRFDIRREQNQHLAFGYGIRYCLGSGLARVELESVFGTLFRRFPTLRLAVPLDQLRLRASSPLGGLEGLPVAW